MIKGRSSGTDYKPKKRDKSEAHDHRNKEEKQREK